jgi:hypothetical protein
MIHCPTMLVAPFCTIQSPAMMYLIIKNKNKNKNKNEILRLIGKIDMGWIQYLNLE